MPVTCLYLSVCLSVCRSICLSVYIDEESSDFYFENLCMSGRDEFFKGYMIRDYERYSVLPVLQSIVFHVCETLSTEQKQEYIKLYLDKGLVKLNSKLLQGFFWKPDHGIDLANVIYSPNVGFI